MEGVSTRNYILPLNELGGIDFPLFKTTMDIALNKMLKEKEISIDTHKMTQSLKLSESDGKPCAKIEVFYEPLNVKSSE